MSNWDLSEYARSDDSHVCIQNNRRHNIKGMYQRKRIFYDIYTSWSSCTNMANLNRTTQMLLIATISSIVQGAIVFPTPPPGALVNFATSSCALLRESLFRLLNFWFQFILYLSSNQLPQQTRRWISQQAQRRTLHWPPQIPSSVQLLDLERPGTCGWVRVLLVSIIFMRVIEDLKVITVRTSVAYCVLHYSP